MKYLLACIVLLAACGADGPPRHSPDTSTGVTVSGEVLMGVQRTL